MRDYSIYQQDYLNISIVEQQLIWIIDQKIVARYEVSTAKNGAGEFRNSGCTPRGWHQIRARIGATLPINSVLVARRWTGEIYHSALAKRFPQRDWILSRILWLGGLEPYRNRYGEVDSTWRYIYIHGSPDESFNGQPQSHGCIRMKNADIIQLFSQIHSQTRVYIN